MLPTTLNSGHRGGAAFFVIQQQFADHGAWYVIGLGVVAIVFALFLPKGLWNLLAERLHLQLLPVGHRLRGPSEESTK